MKIAGYAAAAVLALTGVACDVSLFDSAPRPELSVEPHEVVVEGVRASFTISPAEVERTEAFTAKVTLTNTTGEPVVWTTMHGCLAWLNVYRDGVRVPFEGTNYGCYAALRDWPIPAGESLVGEWTVRAQNTDGTAVPPGRYVVEADLDTRGDLRLQRTLVVR